MPTSHFEAGGIRLAGRPWGAAFTLVEVVIAVGLVAFVLTAILGLAAMAANETKNADLKARLAWITESVTSEYQSQRFSAVLGSLPKTNYWDLFGDAGYRISTDAYFSLSRIQCDAAPRISRQTICALLQVSIRWPYPQLDLLECLGHFRFSTTSRRLAHEGRFLALGTSCCYGGVHWACRSYWFRLPLRCPLSGRWELPTTSGAHRPFLRSRAWRGDLRFAALPANPAASNLQLVINPASRGNNYLLPQAAFWQAPVAGDRSRGNIALVGYFVQWVSEMKAQRHGSQALPALGRLPIIILQKPSDFVSDALIASNAPATKASGYAGQLAENVLGLWMQPLDQ